MCVYSSIVDYQIDEWQKKLDWAVSAPNPPPFYCVTVPNPLTQEEVDALRKLLAEAKRFDEVTGQKECEMEEKKATLRKLAQQLGVDVEFP